MSDFVVPDQIGEAVAWRSWHVLETPWTPPVLTSMNGTEWPSDRWMLARCGNHIGGACGKDETGTPGVRCTCGIYAAKDRPHLLSMGYNRYDPNEGAPTVIGEVALAGKIIPGTQGYRAARARVKSLIVPPKYWRLVTPLQQTYGCDVTIGKILTMDGEEV